MPSFKDFSKSVDSYSVIRSATFFRVTGCHPSGPGDFPGFNFCIVSFTICGVILIESKYSPKNGSFGVFGMSFNRSSVNVLLKNEFNVSAFSFAVFASEPSVFLRGGISLRVFVLDFTYDQKFLGEVLTFCARLLSNDNLSILVNDLSSFLISLYLVWS